MAAQVNIEGNKQQNSFLVFHSIPKRFLIISPVLLHLKTTQGRDRMYSKRRSLFLLCELPSRPPSQSVTEQNSVKLNYQKLRRYTTEEKNHKLNDVLIFYMAKCVGRSKLNNSVGVMLVECH